MNRATPLPPDPADIVEPSPLDALLARPMHRPDLDDDDGSDGPEIAIRVVIVDTEEDDAPEVEQHLDQPPAPALPSPLALVAALLVVTLVLL